MAAKKVRGDTRLNVARYQVDRLAQETVDDTAPDAPQSAASPPAPPVPDDEKNEAGQQTMEQFAQYVEISIQQAMRRGDFDNLPGAGKPIPNLTQTYDPNWWVRQKIEREQLTGLGPPALTLRTEDERLDSRLDRAPSQQAAREILEDFNNRVIEARRQLLGGPPVVTRTRDVDLEMDAWRERRDSRLRALAEAREREAEALAQLSWRQRRRAKKKESRTPRP
jgi:Domain of unknown function (DUF1992)